MLRGGPSLGGAAGDGACQYDIHSVLRPTEPPAFRGSAAFYCYAVARTPPPCGSISMALCVHNPTALHFRVPQAVIYFYILI